MALPQIVLLAGAGFSKWSCQLPLVSELFDFAIHPDNQTEQRRLERLIKIYEHWRAAHPLDHPEAFIGSAQGPASKFNLMNWYITRRLTEVFIVAGARRYTWYINSYYPQQHEGIGRARRILDLLSECGTLNVVTTNYDMVIEYALSSRGFNYGVMGEQIGFKPYPYPQPVHVTGPVKALKLHGSISWSAQRKFPDLRYGLTGKCVVVAPTPDKITPRQLQDQWSFAKTVISQCDVLVSFGFSFNEYDQTFRQFLKKHLPLTSRVVLVDIVDHRSRLASTFGRRNVQRQCPSEKRD